MEAVVGNFYVILLAQMHTDYSTPVISLFVGEGYGTTQSVFKKHIPVCLCLLAKFMDTCSESIQLPFSYVLF